MSDERERCKKLSVPLVGYDGNAFSILARCRAAMRRAGISHETWEEFHTEATSGDYNHLLRTVMEWFDTDSEEEDYEYEE